ncbi:MAG: hypothetical protein AB7F86_11450 [Bdellovibrionales bacterium]
MNRGTKIFFSLMALIIVSGLAIWIRQRDFHPDPVIETIGPNETLSAPVPARIRDIVPLKSSSKSGQNKPKDERDPRFERWLSEEARSMDQPSVDSVEKQARISKVVKKMTEPQSRHLLATARNPRAPAGEKILSTYLLVEGGSRTQGELMALITTPFDGARHEAHSEKEMSGIRDKSLRIMAIDGLFSQAQTDPGARAALSKAAQDIQDPYLKSYAEDRLRQLSR